MEEAKDILLEYPDIDYFVEANYRSWYTPAIGMDDNSMELAAVYTAAYKMVNGKDHSEQS